MKRRLYFFIIAVIFFAPSTAFAQQAPEITAHQQVFAVEQTLNLEELDRYAGSGWIQNEFVWIGIPLLVLITGVIAGALISRRKQRLKCSKQECRRVNMEYIAIGAFNALAFVIIFEILGSVVAPTQLPSLAVYIDDAQVFEQGDRLQLTFDLRNSGSLVATDVEFRNTFADDLRIDESSILLQKDGALPGDALPLLLDDEILVHVGNLEPGEFMQIRFDVEIVTNDASTIMNTAHISGANIEDVTSNPISIRRQLDQSSSRLPRPGTLLVQEAGSVDVFYVEPNNVLRPINAVEAERLYGIGWEGEVQIVETADLKDSIVASPILPNELPEAFYATDGDARCLILNQACRPVTESGLAAHDLTDRYLRVVSTSALNAYPTGELIDHFSQDVAEALGV